MKYPIGIQSFEKIRLGEYTYVDKTALIHQLVNTSNYYFLSRPRRFGKSLLISTLQAYFNGQQELFKGLEIEQLEKEWTKYPVLHLDLNTSKYDEKNSLINVLNDTLCQWENIYGTVSTKSTPNCVSRESSAAPTSRRPARGHPRRRIRQTHAPGHW
mgnify:CR=1 FL=1